MFAAICALVCAVTPVPPAPEHWVADDAGALSSAARVRLENRLESFSAATGHQVVVYVGRGTGGEPIEDFSVRAFAQWKVGRAKLDDGVVLFVMLDDRAARIEVGYGLEDVLTDARCAGILRDELIPRLKAGDVDGAVEHATEAILTAASTGAPAAAPGLTRLDWAAIALVIALLIGLTIWKPRLMLFMLGMFLGRSRRNGGGFGFRGGGGRSGGGGATGHW